MVLAEVLAVRSVPSGSGSTFLPSRLASNQPSGSIRSGRPCRPAGAQVRRPSSASERRHDIRVDRAADLTVLQVVAGFAAGDHHLSAVARTVRRALFLSPAVAVDIG